MVPAGLGPSGFPGQPAGPEAANGLPGQDPSMAPLNGAGQSDGQDPAWRFSDMMQVNRLQFVQALFTAPIARTGYRPSRAVIADPLCCRRQDYIKAAVFSDVCLLYTALAHHCAHHRNTTRPVSRRFGVAPQALHL